MTGVTARSALLAVPVLVVLAWFWWPEERANGAGERPGAAVAAGTGEATGASHWAARGHDALFTSGLEDLPASLAGTDVPDGLHTDDQGNLVVSSGLRDVFDYFLSVIGEEDMDTIVARMRAYLDDQLPPGAAAEANRILNDYLALRESLGDLPGSAGQPGGTLDLAAIRAQQDAIKARRKQFLSADVDQAFFAAQDQWHDYGLSRLAVLEDDSLDPADKAEHLNALRAGLPGGMQQEVDAVLQYQDLQALTHQLEQQGASNADVRLLREQVVGAEAADRLEALEKERAAFASRMDQWLSTRADILSNDSLADADRAAQVARLRDEQFSDSEQLRVQALESVHDRNSAQTGMR